MKKVISIGLLICSSLNASLNAATIEERQHLERIHEELKLLMSEVKKGKKMSRQDDLRPVAWADLENDLRIIKEGIAKSVGVEGSIDTTNSRLKGEYRAVYH